MSDGCVRNDEGDICPVLRDMPGIGSWITPLDALPVTREIPSRQLLCNRHGAYTYKCGCTNNRFHLAPPSERRFRLVGTVPEVVEILVERLSCPARAAGHHRKR